MWTSFAFDAVDDGNVVDDRRWWPTRPLLAVRFKTLSHFIHSTPQATIINLQSIAGRHGVVVPHCCLKPDDDVLLLAHCCGDCGQCLVRFQTLV